MSKFTLFFVFSLFFAVQANAQTETQDWKSKIEIMCGDTLVCFNDKDLEQFSGKTLKYKHLKGSEFGTVSLLLKEDKSVQGSNAKGQMSGTWDIKNNRIFIKSAQWGEFVLIVGKLSNQLFLLNAHDSGVSLLIPLEVTN